MKLRLTLLQQTLILIFAPLIFQLLFVGGLVNLYAEAEAEAKQAAQSKLISDAISELVKQYIELGDTFQWTPDAPTTDIDIAKTKLEPLVRNLDNLIGSDPQHHALVMNLRSLAYEGFDIVKEHRAQGYKEDSEKASKQRVKAIKKKITELFGQHLIPIGMAQKRIAENSPENQARLRDWMKNLLLGLVAFNVAITGLLALFFGRRIIFRLNIMMDNSFRLASRLPLNPVLKGEDEIAHLDHVFHEMAEGIEESARKERAIVENARDVICSLDSKGNFLEVSAACQSVFGFSPQELIGNKFANLVPLDDAQDAMNRLTLISQGELEPDFETRIVRKDKLTIDVYWSVHWSEKEHTFFCVAHDITERKQAERLRQEVVQMVSHDLKSPLASVRGVLEMLSAGRFGELSERGMQLVSMADSSTKRMLGLIKDLLEIERMEAGMLELHKESVTVAKLFEQSIETVYAIANDRKMIVQAEANDITVEADPDRITQVLVNLLSNALKFSPPGSTIKLSARRNNGFIEFAVADQGRGIPHNMLNTIFDRFSQIRASDATKEGGSGLGLAICKALVELHGGDIHVESVENAGATFIFRIPDTAVPTDQSSNDLKLKTV